MRPPLASYFHVHLVSDSTGETLSAVLKATTTQFAAARPIQHIYSMVRSRPQMERALAAIEGAPGVVLYTVLDVHLRRLLEARCSELQAPAVSILDPLTETFSEFLGLERTLKAGAQHEMNEAYFKRIAAVDYTLAHDDGQLAWDIDTADVVIIGVSRTSKTPTSMYLANRGYKVANIPLVPGVDLPPAVDTAKKPLIVGLVAAPERLSQIRQTRLGEAAERAANYADLDAIRAEVLAAKRLFARKRWPVIDVTRKSVEETASTILTKLSERQNGMDSAE